MTRREHEAALIQAAMEWAAGGGGEAENEALGAAVARYQGAVGGVGIDPKTVRASSDLHDLCVAQLVAHKVPATPNAIAACRTACSGFVQVAEADRELLAALVHAVDATVIEPATPELRALLDEAYESGVERLAELEQPTCSRCSCTDEHACAGGCFWVAPNLCSSCLTSAELDVAMLEYAGLAADLEARFEALAARHDASVVVASPSVLEQWAERVGTGENPDLAAIAVGGTGRR